MKLLKEQIRKILKSNLNVRYTIRTDEIESGNGNMTKKQFIEIITQLREVEERKDFLAEEIGMDMSYYEDKFFVVIESLFKVIFNKAQLTLIQMYLYQLHTDEDWDGTITIEQNKQESTVEFKTPANVWDVIQKLK